MLRIKSDALWNLEKWDNSWNKKMAKRVAHARQAKLKKPMGGDSSMRYEWSRRLALTKQSNPRLAKNDPSIHNREETRVSKGQSLPDAPRHDVRSYAKFERKTEPVSRGAGEDVSSFRVYVEKKVLFGDLIIAGSCGNN